MSEIPAAQRRRLLVEAFIEACNASKAPAAHGAIFLRKHILKEAAFAENQGLLEGGNCSRCN